MFLGRVKNGKVPVSNHSGKRNNVFELEIKFNASVSSELARSFSNVEVASGQIFGYRPHSSQKDTSPVKHVTHLTS